MGLFWALAVLWMGAATFARAEASHEPAAEENAAAADAKNAGNPKDILALDLGETQEHSENESGDEAQTILKAGKEAKARALQAKMDDLMRQAEVANKTMDVKLAEELYMKILTHPISETQRRRTLLAMARLFEASKEPAKQAAVLEKFGEAFPDDPGLPQVYIKLGMLYRELGLYNLALTRFYSVLNFALRVDPSKIDTYRQLSVRAQMEIADTHLAQAKYPEAIKLYGRLRMLELVPEDRAAVVFKTANCYVKLKDDPNAILSLETYLRDTPEAEDAPEAMYMLADVYRRVGRQSDAAKTVLQLLKRQSEKYAGNEKQWMYWQRKAGTQLAQNFLDQKDYANALALYQAMLELGEGPDWAWNNWYQIGVCFEKLSMKEKALESFRRIIDWPVAEREVALKSSLALKSVYDMAKWRVDNVGWKQETTEQLQKLLDKKIP